VGEDGSMSPEAKLSWMIAAIAVAMFVLIMAWLYTALEKSGSLVKDAHHHTPYPNSLSHRRPVSESWRGFGEGGISKLPALAPSPWASASP
jgi:hypothetical protein